MAYNNKKAVCNDEKVVIGDDEAAIGDGETTIGDKKIDGDVREITCDDGETA